ncbi:type VI secretion system transmembrane protein TssO [Flavobacterium johnsoniae]|uniref:type VI secretion system TssO n=1 Tax=Flavobacterium johnsoniae TaxID=986 RepID=UPI0025AF590A|nr:type VI secretion system TssO [Flavobacterium johnsoniae]WJS92809.1 type VI secretion system transmembrane protein TssO [Flavobacterium johnsoniae]
MEVLNKKERQKAFYAFLCAFIITFIVMFSALAFNLYLPTAENKILKAENEMMKREYDYQTSFSIKIDSVRMTIDSINSPKVDNDFQQRLANVMVANIYQKIPKDTTDNKRLYNNIILAYKNIIDYKKQIRSLTHNAHLIDSLNQSAKTYKEELEKVSRDLDVCRQIYQNQ